MWLRFDDGVEGIVDLSDMVGKGVFELWDDPAAFRAAHLGRLGELCWGERIDLCPNSLYLEITGLSTEEFFVKNGSAESHA